MNLRWESQRGDDWWCGDAFASLEHGTLLITDFGAGCTPGRALALIRAATDQFDGPPWVHFSDKTSVADDLLDTGAVTSMQSLGPHRIRLVITP